MTVSRNYKFNEGSVREWCERADDHNPFHLHESAVGEDEVFEERVVPGMLLLDKVSGLITQWSETTDGTPVLTRVSGVTFEKPVFLDEEVAIVVVEDESQGDEYKLFFEVVGTGGPQDRRAHGYADVTLA